MINLNNKKFKALNNAKNGEVDEQTIFHYYQNDKIIWATYEGGQILKGTITGYVNNNNQLIFNYQHLNNEFELMTGKCTSTIELMSNGKVLLDEKWQWTCKDHSKGESKVIEV